MVPPGKEAPPARKKQTHERFFTIMIMGRVGKVRSFRMSRRLLFWAVLFFAAYVPFSVYLVNRYFEARTVTMTQRQRIERLEKDLLRSSNALSRSKEHIAFLEEYISQSEKSGDQTVEPDKFQGKRAETVTGKPFEEQAQNHVGETVSVEDLVIERQGEKLAVTFKLVNLLPGDSSVGGYVYVLARNEKSSPRQEWTYPPVKLINGLPETHKRGQVFLIQRFKLIQGKLTVGSAQDTPTILEILAYDQAGNVIAHKNFKIDHAA
jgi:hypothetical protein